MVEATKAGFLDRTLRNLRNAWQSIAGSEYGAETASMRPHLPDDDIPRLREQMLACLAARGGEVSARARAAALGRAYLNLDETGRRRFLAILAQEFDVDRPAVDAAITAVQQVDDIESRCVAEARLKRAMEAPRLRLLTQFNGLPDGIKFLVDMRAELLSLARQDPVFTPVETDLKGLLAAWFDVGLLELHEITWQSASAALLERLIAYEAVHAIKSWDDMKNRLATDRRCFAFFHPRMPDEPLIFVEVALVSGLADNVQVLLDESVPAGNPQKADTAIFYSISNAQKGLAGISFGNFLIKRVVDVLAAEFKGLKIFATLSPVPGFRPWLERALSDGEPHLLLAAERKALKKLADDSHGAKGALKALLEDVATWHRDPAVSEALKPPLMRLCARYLTQERRPDGKALDPVAHFHLTNGARMERLNWLADTSANGLRQSAGIMINYLYKLGEIDDNHEAYTGAGKIAASSAIRSLVKG
ncbi:MAG: malonyl-CoA decarboxylase [Rhodospirillales bacterium]|jgi:malonyl-CoA decarboxylase|nr:malonyl-CoA decarboxylase [Rhodospirillales bacterium]